MKKIKLFFLFLLSLFANELFAQKTCDWSIINEASSEFKIGNFKEVLSKLEDCTKSGFDVDQKVEAYRLIAKCYFALDQDTLALASIKEILKINPSYQADLLSDTPDFIFALREAKLSMTMVQVTSVSKKAEDLNKAPAPVLLISEKQISERGYNDLEAVLHDLPGFDISRSNGNLYTHAYQRGYRSINTNRTLFLVDGVEENDLWSSNVYLSRQYALSNVKNIEIVYGPASTMYGSNAFLGVINVLTKQPTDYIQEGKIFGVNAQLAYGSYNTKFLDASFAAQTKSKNLSISLTPRIFFSDEQDLSSYPWHSYAPRSLTDELTATYHEKLDLTGSKAIDFYNANSPSSYFDFDNINSTVTLTDAGVAKALEYDNVVYDKVGFSDKTEAYSLEGKIKISDLLIGMMIWNKAEGPGAQYNDNSQMTFDQGQSWRPSHKYFYIKYDKDIVADKLNMSSFLRYMVHDFGRNNNIVTYTKNYVSGSYSLQDLVNGVIPKWDSLFLFQKSNQLREEFKILYMPTSKIDIVSGFEMRLSAIQGDYTASKTNDAEQTGTVKYAIPGGNHFFSTDLGFYAQAGILATSNLKLTLGIRYDNNKVRETEGYGNAFNPRLVAVYSPSDFVFKLIYSEAFKDATYREKYSTAGTKRELSNPGLAPEKVKNLEFSLGRKIGKNIYANFTSYWAKYSNIIQEVSVQKADGSYTNQNQSVGKAQVMGVNANADYTNNNLTIFANYTYTLPFILNPQDANGNPTLDENGNPYDKLRISDISSHQLNLGANFLFKKVYNFNLRMNYRGERKTGENTTVPNNSEHFGPIAVFNRAFNYTPIDFYGLSFRFSIFNILNTEYFSPGLDDASGVLSSKLKQNGRNMYLSILLKL